MGKERLFNGVWSVPKGQRGRGALARQKEIALHLVFEE